MGKSIIYANSRNEFYIYPLFFSDSEFKLSFIFALEYLLIKYFNFFFNGLFLLNSLSS